VTRSSAIMQISARIRPSTRTIGPDWISLISGDDSVSVLHRVSRALSSTSLLRSVTALSSASTEGTVMATPIISISFSSSISMTRFSLSAKDNSPRPNASCR